jgi:hypothetical protein
MRRIAVLLVAVGLAVWLAAPALSTRPFVPRAVEFEQSLAAGRAGATGPWRSGVVRAPRRFDLVGLTWRGGGASLRRARIRVRSVASGRWSAWATLRTGDAGSSRSTEPVWAGGADAYELSLARRPPALRARFVNATGTATATARVVTALRRAAQTALAAIAGTPARAQAAPGAPPIIPREAWGADQCKPRTVPAYGEVQVGFVHHTVDANDYGPQDSAAMVLAICRYHRDTNGWRDIGYNFLVDRYGQVFEGRAGGVDQPVVGAQAQGYNGVSTGVANLGTFTDVAQTPESVHATAQLLAWKLSLHGVPVTGEVTVRSAGGPTNRYAAGRDVTFARIAGHRDADVTACPGDALFAQLPQIRREAAALAPPLAALAQPQSALSIAVADATLDYPQPAQVSGVATGAGGAPLAGAPISLQVGSAAGFITRARAQTGADGRWSAQLPTQYSRTLRAVARLPAGGFVTSPRIAVAVAPRITLRAARHVAARRSFTVTGSVRPAHVRVALVVARQGRDRAMHVVARIPVKASGRRFTVKLRLRRPALHRLRIVSVADDRNTAGRSGDVLLRAVRPRR